VTATLENEVNMQRLTLEKALSEALNAAEQAKLARAKAKETICSPTLDATKVKSAAEEAKSFATNAKLALERANCAADFLSLENRAEFTKMIKEAEDVVGEAKEAEHFTSLVEQVMIAHDIVAEAMSASNLAKEAAEQATELNNNLVEKSFSSLTILEATKSAESSAVEAEEKSKESEIIISKLIDDLKTCDNVINENSTEEFETYSKSVSRAIEMAGLVKKAANETDTNLTNIFSETFEILKKASSEAVEAAESAKSKLRDIRQASEAVSDEYTTLEVLIDTAEFAKSEIENISHAAQVAEKAAATTNCIFAAGKFGDKDAIALVRAADTAAEEAMEASKSAASLAFTLAAKQSSAEALEAAKLGKSANEKISEFVKSISKDDVTLEEVEDVIMLAEVAASEANNAAELAKTAAISAKLAAENATTVAAIAVAAIAEAAAEEALEFAQSASNSLLTVNHQKELLKKAELEKIEVAKRVAEAEKRVAEAERQLELERIEKAKRLAEEQRLAELERIAEEERQLEAAKRAEAERLLEEQRRAEQERLAELARIEAAKRLAEAQRIEEERKRIEAERLAEYHRIEEAKLLAFDEAVAYEASHIAGNDPPVFYGGRKNVQIQQIQKFLIENIKYANIKKFLNDKPPYIQMDLTASKVSNLEGAKQDQISNEVTEIFPGLHLGSFLTLSENCIAKHGIATVVEVSKELHDVPAVGTVTHLQTNGASTDESFDKIADRVEEARKEGGSTLISCEENTGLAATLSIAYAIKYKGMTARVASKTVSKRRPKAGLDQTTLIKLSAWEWKLRRKQLYKNTMNMVATWLPMVSVLALLCLALRLFQDEIERQHQEEKTTPEYEYFHILKWP